MSSSAANVRRFGGRGPLAIHPQAMAVAYEQIDVEDAAQIVDGVAVVTIEGPLAHKTNLWFDSYEQILARFTAALAADDARSVLLKIDSPGGDAAGLVETVRAMQRAKRRSGKLVVAYADEAAYSAAYALACVADEIYLPEAGGVGSVGVITEIVDVSAANAAAGINVEVFASGDHKTDGNANVPISDGARERVQHRVDQLAGLFWRLVSRARGMSTGAVRALEAGTFAGADAVRVGLADDVGSLAEIMERLKIVLAQPRVDSVGDKQRPAAGGDGDIMKLLTLVRAVTDAEAALALAARPEDKRAATERLTAARNAVAAAEAKAEKAEDDAEADAEDDAEAECAECGEKAELDKDGMCAECAKKADAAAEDEEDDDKDDEDDGEEDDSTAAVAARAKENAALMSAPSGIYTHARLLRLCQQVTRKADVREVFGALDALNQRAAAGDEALRRVARLERAAQRARVTAMLAAARKAGKITRAMQANLGGQDPKWLRGYLATLPVLAPARETRPEDASTIGGALVTASQLRIWQKMGLTSDQIATAAKEHATLAAAKPSHNGEN